MFRINACVRLCAVLVFPALALSALIFVPLAHADFDWCGFQHDREGNFPGGHVYGDTIQAKFIFVGFPEDPCDSTLHYELQMATVDTIAAWINDHSQGNLVLKKASPGFSPIVLPPGAVFQSEGDTASAWMADLPASAYPDVSSNSDYMNKWSGGEADISSWWGSGSISKLYAEILYKVYDEYTATGSGSPFGFYVPDSPESDHIDALFFVFLSRNSPFGDYGGTTWITVVTRDGDDPAGIFAFEPATGVTGLEFFGMIKTGESGSGYFQGTGQAHNSSEEDTSDPTYYIENTAMVVLHEFVHTLGFGEGPPALQNLNAGSLERYYWGNLNVSSQKFYPGHGIPIMSLHNLARTGWVTVDDFTGENRLSQKVYDIRSYDGAGKRGVVYKYRMEGHPELEDQYFLFAYHAGVGVDVQGYPAGQEPVRSRGLEVQHCVGDDSNDPDVVDMESAFGLFSNIQVDTIPDVDLPPPAVGLGDAVAPPGVWGFDNWDLWWLGDDPANGLRKMTEGGGYPVQWAGYTKYLGSPFDFFSPSEYQLPAGGGSWSAPEFSFRTSPSTFWYNTAQEGAFSGARMRFNDQDIPCSLFVRVREQHDSGTVDDPLPHVIVDFVSAPFEEVNVVTGDTYQSGDTLTFSYSYTPGWGDEITGFDVYFCPTANEGLAYHVGGDVVPKEVRTFDVPITDQYGTQGSSGHLLVKFHNSSGGEDGLVRVGPVFVQEPPAFREEVLAPAKTDLLVSGQMVRVEWTSYFDSMIYSSVDVEYDSGSGFTLIESLGVTTPYHFDPVTGRNYGEVKIPEGMVSLDASLRLEFCEVKNGQKTTLFTSDPVDELRVLPPVQKYDDISESAIPDQDAYEGVPRDLAPLSVEGSGGPGVVMALETTVGQSNGVVYKRGDDPSEGIAFFRLSPFSGYSGIPFSTDFQSLAVADYDGDGDDDFFACNPSAGASVLFKNTGGHFLGVNLNSSPTPEQDTSHAQCATWIDVDHDGDLDLFIGRGDLESTTGVRNSLFRNEFIPAGGDSFSQAIESFSLLHPRKICLTRAVSWSDFDGDGYWDVLVGDASKESPETLVFRQGSDGAFTLDQTVDSPFKDKAPMTMALVDMDRDNELDFMLRTKGSRLIQVYPGVQGGFFAEPRDTELPFIAADVIVHDGDRDGWSDFLAFSGAENRGFSRLWNGAGAAGYDLDFLDVGAMSGFPETGVVTDGLVADFDLDGRPDIFSGCEDPHAGKAVWKAQTGSAEGHWLGITLDSVAGPPPVGARVAIRDATGPLGAYSYQTDNGSGAQSGGPLLVGVGDAMGPFTVTVDWPSREASQHQVSALDQYITLAEPLAWDFVPGSFRFELIFRPGVTASWVFTWETLHWTKATEDWVEVYPTGNCGDITGGQVFSGASPGVSTTITYKVDPNTGQAKYQHRLEARDMECSPGCTIEYTVHSGDAQITMKSAGPEIGRLPKYCPVISQ